MASSRAGIVRGFLLIEVVLFALASLLHHGLPSEQYAHARAAVAEGVIALVLAFGLAICVYQPSHTRIAALITQSIAMFGVAIAVVMNLAGAGPRNIFDYTVHVVMLVTLWLGLLAARRVAYL